MAERPQKDSAVRAEATRVPGPDVPDDLTPPPEAPPRPKLPAAPSSETERAQQLVEAGESLEEYAEQSRADETGGALPSEQESHGQESG